MAMQPWLYTLIGIVGVFHVFALLYAWYTLQFTDNREQQTTQDQLRDPSEVACPACGTTNERGYRFCGYCVAELPGARSMDWTPSAPSGRTIR